MVFDAALDVLLSSLRRTAGVTVTYARGADSGTMTAIPGRTDHEEYGPDDYSITSRFHDWIVAAADLELASAGAVTPQPDDEITDAAGNTYRVLPLTGDRCFSWVSQQRLAYRIHTQLVP